MSNLNIKLKVWRQKNSASAGEFVTYDVAGISEHASFLEMLDFLNEKLISEGKDPVEFDSDCREGICGSCSMMVNGCAHGPELGATTCQLHMRAFRDGETVVIEPWRAKAFPVIKDLVVDRSAMDRIMAAGGYTGAKSGRHIDANAILIPKETQEKAMDAAECIGCGACVAACPNASAALFTGAKITQYALLPQGAPLREERVKRMVEQMDKEGFGNCSNIGECSAACPKSIKIDVIATMRREFVRAL